MNEGKVSALLVHGADPAFGLPGAVGFKEALSKVPLVVSFSSFMDETTALADLVLPDHSYLESWGDAVPSPGPGFQAVGAQQAVVNPYFTTQGFGDVLLAVAQRLELSGELPWNDLRDAVREGAQALFALKRGSVQAASPEEFWVRFLQQGGWWDPQARSTASVSQAPAAPEKVEARFAGSERDYPFHLMPFASNSLADGSLAHLPWLQAAPDPVTTAVWQTWVEINRKRAQELDIREGDVLVIESPAGAVEARAYLNPAAPPDVLAVPVGQGHGTFTRYAANRGANVFAVLDPGYTDETGALAWAATRVRIRKAGRRERFAKFEGGVLPIQLEERPVIEFTPG